MTRNDADIKKLWESFELIVKKETPALNSFAMTKLGLDINDAHDLIQMLWLKWIEKDYWKDTKKLESAYLIVALKHLHLDKNNTARTYTIYDEQKLIEQAKKIVERKNETTSSEVWDTFKTWVISRGKSGKILLKWLQGYSYKELAIKYGKKRGAIRVIIHRQIKEFKETYYPKKVGGGG